MTNGSHQHQGVLGDATPPTPQSNSSHTHSPGQISNIR
jgi:hypothetical protein